MLFFLYNNTLHAIYRLWGLISLSGCPVEKNPRYHDFFELTIMCVVLLTRFNNLTM